MLWKKLKKIKDLKIIILKIKNKMIIKIKNNIIKEAEKLKLNYQDIQV